MSAWLRRAIPGLDAASSYRRSWLVRDVVAGATLWAMLVPQSLGFATLAGLPPVVGLYSACGAMACYWLWGSSRHLNVGAESTVAIMVATILGSRAGQGSPEYVALAALLALLVGLVLLVGGMLRLGRVADFLSRPVLAGYVIGSGVLIVSSQLQGLLGTDIDAEPYLTEWGAVVRNFDRVDPTSVWFGAASLVAILVLRRWVPVVPGALVAVAVSMLAVALLDLQVAVVGEFAGGLPAIALPDVAWTDVVALAGPALAIALLVYPDSVLTARSLTFGTSDRVDADREFFGVGAANLGSGLLGGFPVNGSQSRSFVLRDAYARTQAANLVATVLVLLTLAFLAPLFDYLPTATLAAIVIAAGLALLDPRELGVLWRLRRSELTTAVVTVVAVLSLGMLVGIVVAVGLSLLLVVLRTSAPHSAVLGLVPGTDTYRDVADYPEASTITGLLIYRFDAPVFFANAGQLRDEVLAQAERLDVDAVVLDMEAVHDVDTTGLQVLLELLDELDRRGVTLEMARVRTEIRDELRVAGVEPRLLGGDVHLEVDDAVAHYLRRTGREPGDT